MIQYPHLRKELILNLRALADSTYQRKVWTHLELPTANYEDSFGEVIHFIFDDMNLNTYDVNKAIDNLLYNDTEAKTVENVIEKLDSLLEKMGTNATDQEYINSPYWPDILEAANKAYELLTGGQKAQGMFEDIRSGWQPELIE